MTDTGEYADYVLPDTTTFERTELLTSFCHLTLQEPAIEPQGESRDISYLMRELSKRLGIGEYFDKTAEDWIKIQLNSQDPAIVGITPPVTFERLKKEKMIRANVPEGPFDMYALFMQTKIPTASGRLEFYKEELADIGEPMAKYVPALEVGDEKKREKYPYQFFTGRQRFFMQSFFNDDPMLAKLSGGKPSARMNPEDAEREGIKDGDLVECYNDRGRMQTTMRLDNAVPVGTVHMWYGWRHRHYKVGMYSDLLVDVGSDETMDSLAQKNWETVEKMGSIGPFVLGCESGTAGAWDTLWDAVCAVRKVTGEEGDQNE